MKNEGYYVIRNSVIYTAPFTALYESRSKLQWDGHVTWLITRNAYIILVSRITNFKTENEVLGNLEKRVL